MTDDTRAKREWVYFAQVDGTGPIKIGYSREPERRMDKLGTEVRNLGIGRRAVLRGVMPGNRWVERWLHRHFAAQQIAGEWFRPEPPLTTLLEVLGDYYRNRQLAFWAALDGKPCPATERLGAALRMLGVEPE